MVNLEKRLEKAELVVKAAIRLLEGEWDDDLKHTNALADAVLEYEEFLQGDKSGAV